jgi:hypothetical protein
LGAIVFAAIAAAVSIATLSAAGLAAGDLPRWAAALGFVVAFAQVFAILYMPLLLLPLWVLFAAAMLSRRPREPA